MKLFWFIAALAAAQEVDDLGNKKNKVDKVKSLIENTELHRVNRDHVSAPAASSRIWLTVQNCGNAAPATPTTRTPT